MVLFALCFKLIALYRAVAYVIGERGETDAQQEERKEEEQKQ